MKETLGTLRHQQNFNVFTMAQGIQGLSFWRTTNPHVFAMGTTTMPMTSNHKLYWHTVVNMPLSPLRLSVHQCFVSLCFFLWSCASQYRNIWYIYNTKYKSTCEYEYTYICTHIARMQIHQMYNIYIVCIYIYLVYPYQSYLWLRNKVVKVSPGWVHFFQSVTAEA